MVRSPLQLAVEHSSLDMVLLLLSEGAKPNDVGKAIVHVASGVESPTDDPRDALYQSPVRCVPVQENALHVALTRGNTDMVRALIIAGADKTTCRFYDGEEQSVESLVNGNPELLEALETTSEWTPETHKFFASRLREQVRAVLLVAKAKAWQLPEDALVTIFKSLAQEANKARSG
jgi:hypothetical protein